MLQESPAPLILRQQPGLGGPIFALMASVLTLSGCDARSRSAPVSEPVSELMGETVNEPTNEPGSGPMGAADPSADPSADRARYPASPIPEKSRQMIVGITESWSATDAELRMYRRAAGGEWQASTAPWSATVGRTGVAWGRGLHGHAGPEGQPGPVKREGDGKAPAGLFALLRVYGYHRDTSTEMDFTPVTDSYRCVNDSASAHYNKIVDKERIAEPDWRSAEIMRRRDERYRLVIEVGHNDPAAGVVAEGGSCIFLHLWGRPGEATAGCTAMDGDHMAQLLAILEPSAQPVYVLLPRDRYQELAPRWGLPPAW